MHTPMVVVQEVAKRNKVPTSNDELKIRGGREVAPFFPELDRYLSRTARNPHTLNRRPFAALSDRLIAQQHVPVGERPRLGRLHTQLLLDAFEQRAPFAENDRYDHEMVLVDQPLFRQLRYDRAASQNAHPSSVLVLQFSYLRPGIALHELRVVPRDCLKRP